MVRHKTDIRIIRTKKAIKDAFCEMLDEMDYRKVTIKALTARAGVSRNTFYLHYSSVADLLDELQNQLALQFTETITSYGDIGSLEKTIEAFFDFASGLPSGQEKLLCCGGCEFIAGCINAKLAQQRAESKKGVFGKDAATENMIFAYYGGSLIVLYRQWAADGKKISAAKAVKAAKALIMPGLKAFIN